MTDENPTPEEQATPEEEAAKLDILFYAAGAEPIRGLRFGRVTIERPDDVKRLGFAGLTEFALCVANVPDNPLEHRRFKVWQERDGLKHGLLRAFPGLQRLQRAGDISGNDYDAIEREAARVKAKQEAKFRVGRVDLKFTFYPDAGFPGARLPDLAVEVAVVCRPDEAPVGGDVLSWSQFGLEGLPGVGSRCVVDSSRLAERRTIRDDSMQMIGASPYGQLDLTLRPLDPNQEQLLGTYGDASRNVHQAEQERKLFLEGLSVSLGWPAGVGSKL